MMKDKFLRWIIFSILVALLPLMLNALRMLSRGVTPTLEILLSRGELLLISVAIAATALGELLVSHAPRKQSKLVAGGASVLLLCLNSFWYADITTALIEGVVLEEGFVSQGSLTMFILTLFSSGSCVLLTEV